MRLSSIIKKTLVVCLSALACIAFGQGRMSPKLNDKAFNFEADKTTLSISVIDSSSFQKKYANRITLLRKQNESNCFLIRLQKRTTLDELKNDPNVIFVDYHQKAREESVQEYANWNFNRITKLRHFFPDLNGASQNVSVKEQGFDPLDIDLVNRSFITQVTPSTVSQHATSMTTLIAGAGNSSSLSKGAAPMAHFTSSDFSNILPDNAFIFTSNNIYVQNHSYGVGIENYYGNEAFAYDQQVSNNPALLHVFSAGNSGKLKPASGIYMNMEFANLTGNFKQAKNVLVVNAVNTTLSANALNSRGPAFDGRLKPELTAFGQDGTSDAAAIVSGISVLLQEKHQLIKQQVADASLIKAILIASADDIGPPGIDYVYGYGSVNAYNAIKLMDANQLISTILASDEEISIPINIPATVSEIRIAISWSDPPATPNTTNVLINDIDSWLDDGSTITQPWVLNPFPHVDSLRALPERKPDHLNNTEFITINKPAPGTYQLHFKAGILTNATQKVSVAYWLNEEKTFRWDFPLASDLVEVGEKNLLIWEAIPDQTGDLYLQLDNNEWHLIKSGIDLNNYFSWSCPDNFSKAKLKMRIGDAEFVTDEFLISPVLKVKTAFVCTDSIGLTWNSTKNATGYELYSMGDQYLQKISTTSDTVIVLSKSSDLFFSVSPVSSEASGMKSNTINYTQQGALCYLNLFTAERFNVKQVRVQLQLSSWYQVERVTIFKASGGNKSILKEISTGESLAFQFYDSELQAGTMTWQAEIILQNGIKIVSDLIEIIIEDKGKAIIFPNPVTSNTYLTILSQGGGVRFRIQDLFGRILFEKELTLVMDEIDVINLPAGMYVYHLLSNENITDTGRFIKY